MSFLGSTFLFTQLIPRMAWLDQMIGLGLTVLEIDQLFSNVIIPLHEESVFSHKLPQ